MSPIRRSTLMIPVVILLCALLGGFYGGRVKATSGASDDDTQQSLKTLTQVYAAVEENYADAVAPDKAIYNGAIPGMLRTLDPHTNFFDPKSYQLLREEQRGKYYGVGMQVESRGGKTIVKVPFVGSPAYKAGLRPGDIIAQVDDKPTDKLNTTEVADLLKGAKGTQVRILVIREGSPKPLEFIITRDEIPRLSIEQAYEIRPGIGYISIGGFSETTSHELAAALRKVDVRSVKGLILDLRSNPGGLLTEGVNVSDMFLAKNQVIVSYKGRATGEKIYRALHGNGGVEYPLVVLINRSSASASEIVAGAIQDHDRGLVLGETSFGKGMVQTVYPLSDNTGLALTTAFYYTPSGRLIQRKFTGLSLYDYYYLREDNAATNEAIPRDTAPKEVRLTDSGRTVYGGGGITPDEKVSVPPLKGFLRTLEVDKYAFFNFAKFYLADHNTIPHNFVVDDSVMAEFRRYLDHDKVAYTDADLQQNLDYVKRRIKQELFISIFGKIEGDRIRLDSDPVVLKAIEAMPKAKELADNARRVLAQERHLR